MSSPSIPEKFLSVWALIQSIPEYNVNDPVRWSMQKIRSEAIANIEQALYRAYELVQIANTVVSDIKEMKKDGEATP